MNETERQFKTVDVVLIILMLLPIVFGMVLKILTTPVSDDIAITGALIYFTLKMPFGEIPITESQVNSWLVILSVFWLCLYLTHGITAKGGSRRQHFAEWIIEKTDSLVQENMGEFFQGFAPFIAAVMALSAFSSLLSLVGLYPPTSDLNVVAGWAILVFILITHYKFKCGPIQYLKALQNLSRFWRRLILLVKLQRRFPWLSAITETFFRARSYLCWSLQRLEVFQTCCWVGCPEYWERYLSCRSGFQPYYRYILMCSADYCKPLFLLC